MRIVSYNVNGIRSAFSKGLVSFMQHDGADVFCFQEMKADEHQLPEPEAFDQAGYTYRYWHSAQKKGYSGVALFCKQKPDHIEFGSGTSHDVEGRIIRADFGDISVISVYIPSGSSGEDRQAYKMIWLDFFQNYIRQLRKTRPRLIICGDYNICHQAIDIHDPISNKNSSGFLPEERDWFSSFLEDGFVDSFRLFHPEPHQYSWWSFRAASRERNKGWRIDYCLADQSLQTAIQSSGILPEQKHSDHCPVWIELSI